jgi:hypothetical protein
VLIALHREDDVLDGLLEAINGLVWPADRLETLLLVEEGDTVTLEALARLGNRHSFQQVVIPDVAGPRTKPRALQTGLAFARGEIICVYDAEDRPDPHQLLAAAVAFERGGAQVGVVQAPLVAEPDAGSWIAAQFALDYAVWFRVVLPFLARLSAFVPLGGTSNHFRRAALDAVGGWDPWNLTEDADLAVRLARGGWTTVLIAPPTLEETPPHLAAWLRQRARWIQGHLQTLSVHLRAPQACWRGLGWRGFAGLVVGLGIGPLAGLWRLAALVTLPVQALGGHGTALALAAAGLVCEALAAAAAVGRDGRAALWAALPGLPLYGVLQGVAGLLALRGALASPHCWAKTEHGARARVAPSCLPFGPSDPELPSGPGLPHARVRPPSTTRVWPTT